MKKYITLIIITAALTIFYFQENRSSKAENKKITSEDIFTPPTIDDIIKNGIPNDTSDFSKGVVYETDDYTVIEGVVNPGQAITHILKEYNIDHTQIYKMGLAAEGVFDLNIHPNKSYTVICSKDTSSSAQCFVYKKSNESYIVVDFRDSIKVYENKQKVETRPRIISGKITNEKSSLWIALSSEFKSIFPSRKNKESATATLSMLLEKDIYGWTIDFHFLQENDSFTIYFDEKYINNKFIGIGTIHAAYFIHKNKNIKAFRFREHEAYADYFDEHGNNLRKAFLKAPLYNFRISSKYGKRKHPISGKWKNHNGTDYAAPTGTKVMTTANGTISEAGYKRGYGNYVKVRHNEKYTTLYAHLSKIEKGIYKGAYVQQADVIGRVGSTGYATGPHLHYEFWVNGKQVDHFKQELPPSEPLKQENKEKFNKVLDDFSKKIDSFRK